MKILKFRVWSKHLNKFLSSYKNNGLLFETINGYLNISEIIQDSNLVIQQYTGLKDSKNIEIYEGDILLVKGYDDWFDVDGHDYKLTVKWQSEENGDVSESCGYLYIPKDREIIGNIFEK